jgi:hypothetical protein
MSRKPILHPVYRFGFPGVLGAIDGTQVHIVAPPANHPVHPAIAYMDRRGNYSINVQIICTSDHSTRPSISRFCPRFSDLYVKCSKNFDKYVES